MKAKEYADRYIAAGMTNDALYAVWLDMFNEVKDLSLARHSKSDVTVLAVFRELEQKWKAFARLAGAHVREDGFVKMTEHMCPEFYDQIKAAEIRWSK